MNCQLILLGSICLLSFVGARVSGSGSSGATAEVEHRGGNDPFESALKGGALSDDTKIWVVVRYSDSHRKYYRRNSEKVLVEVFTYVADCCKGKSADAGSQPNVFWLNTKTREDRHWFLTIKSEKEVGDYVVLGFHRTKETKHICLPHTKVSGVKTFVLEGHCMSSEDTKADDCVFHDNSLLFAKTDGFANWLKSISIVPPPTAVTTMSPKVIFETSFSKFFGESICNKVEGSLHVWSESLSTGVGSILAVRHPYTGVWYFYRVAKKVLNGTVQNTDTSTSKDAVSTKFTSVNETGKKILPSSRKRSLSSTSRQSLSSSLPLLSTDNEFVDSNSNPYYFSFMYQHVEMSAYYLNSIEDDKDYKYFAKSDGNNQFKLVLFDTQDKTYFSKINVFAVDTSSAPLQDSFYMQELFYITVNTKVAIKGSVYETAYGEIAHEDPYELLRLIVSEKIKN